MSNRNNRVVFMFHATIVTFVNIVGGAIAFLDIEDRRETLTFVVAYDVGLIVLVTAYALAHKFFPKSKD